MRVACTRYLVRKQAWSPFSLLRGWCEAACGIRIAVCLLTLAGSLWVVQITTATKSEAAATDLAWVWKKDLAGKVLESSPLPVDLNGGGIDLVVGAHDSKVYGLDGIDGSNVGGWPVSVSHGVNSSASTADTDGDGHNEIFIGSGVGDLQECSGGGMYSLRLDGSQRWLFNATDPDCGSEAIHTAPAIGDINRDGTADITFGGLGLHSWSLDQGGNVNPGWPFYADDTQFSTPALADVNGDGQTDAIIGGDSTPGGPVDHRGGLLRAIDGDGSLKWSFLADEIIRSSPSVGDIDGDGKAEIVVGTGNQTSRTAQGSNDATKVFVLNLDGTVKWSRDTGAQTMASPTLADINGDNKLDVIEATWESPKRQDLGAEGKIWAWDGNGNVLSGFPRESGGGIVIGQISTLDINGDNGQDLLVPTGNGIYAYNGKTGGLMFTLLKDQNISFQNTPAVTDVDNDGHPDILVAGVRTDNNQGVAARFELSAGTYPNASLGNNGWPMFHKDARRTGSATNPPLAQSLCAANDPTGYRLAASDGGLFSFCGAQFHGSMGGQHLNQPIIASASTPDGGGYWMVASDGGMFSFGSAQFRGSMGGQRLNEPIVAMASTNSGNGYWMVARDGGIFAFGDAKFFGSTGGQHLNEPIVGMAATPSGNGYWLVARDGGIFAYGDAQFHGSMGGRHLNQPIVSMASTSGGDGYWMVASDGGIFAFDAPFAGSTGGIKLNQPIIGIAVASRTNGYWLLAKDGGIFAFNAPFLGSTGSRKLNAPIVSISAV